MMKRQLPRAAAMSLLAAGLATGLAASAGAQSRLEGGKFARPDSETRKPEIAPPRGLPGARGERMRAAPAERPPSEMRPTEALFDAVNRGDVAAARDAITRGAEIEGRNILGLTPLELAIDLGRNEMTFLLLSMRGMGASTPPAVPVREAAPAHRAAPRPAPARVAPVPAAPARQRQAGGGGTPMPSAGFLGFGTAVR